MYVCVRHSLELKHRDATNNQQEQGHYRCREYCALDAPLQYDSCDGAHGAADSPEYSENTQNACQPADSEYFNCWNAEQDVQPTPCYEVLAFISCPDESEDKVEKEERAKNCVGNVKNGLRRRVESRSRLNRQDIKSPSKLTMSMNSRYTEGRLASSCRAVTLLPPAHRALLLLR